MSSETAQIVAMAKTLDLVTRGAKLGDVECMSALGVGHMEGIGLFYQDYNEAVKWLRPAAERGNAAAQNNLGICYLHGHGVTQDYGMAAGWIRKAAEQGDTLAAYHMGGLYHIGHGVAQSPQQAFNWWLKAAQGGHAIAQCNVALMYEQGEVVRQNLIQAHKWMSLAGEQQHADAAEDAKVMASKMAEAQLAESRQGIAAFRLSMRMKPEPQGDDIIARVAKLEALEALKAGVIADAGSGGYLKSECPHCGQSIEYPAAGTGQTVPCPTCEQPFVLVEAALPYTPAGIPQIRFPTPYVPLSPDPPLPPPLAAANEKLYVRLAQLTEKSITRRLPHGSTYIHSAVAKGMLAAIPAHLLAVQHFLAQNNCGETPLHVAARRRLFGQIPSCFLTKETMTVWDKEGKTPLHTLADRQLAYRIPKEFLTREFLTLPTRDASSETILHHIAAADMLYLIPNDCMTTDMWDLKDARGQTPRTIFERERKELAKNTATDPWHADPATEKQKQKLRYFGCVWDDGITKGQASTALDKCARDFPEVDEAYYNRPATDDQVARLRPILKVDGEEPSDYAADGKTLTYREAKHLTEEIEMAEVHEERVKEARDTLLVLVSRTDYYPSLTLSRVRKAAAVLDATCPGWAEGKDSETLLKRQLVGQFPELAAKEHWPIW